MLQVAESSSNKRFKYPSIGEMKLNFCLPFKTVKYINVPNSSIFAEIPLVVSGKISDCVVFFSDCVILLFRIILHLQQYLFRLVLKKIEVTVLIWNNETILHQRFIFIYLFCRICTKFNHYR